MKNRKAKAAYATGLIAGLSVLLLSATPHLSAQSVDDGGASASAFPVEARPTDQVVAQGRSAPEKSLEPRVRVKIVPRLSPEVLTPRESAFPPAAYVVHLDEQGRVAPPPPGARARVRRTPAPQFVFIFVGTSPGGGIGADASHITTYSYATVGPDGTLRSGCVQGSLEEVQAKMSAVVDADESQTGEAIVKRETAQD